MFRPRVIPVILIGEHGHAIKTARFKSPIDLGDSVNTVSLFNAFKVDELVILDVLATREGRTFRDALMADLASEARMPLAVGGGVRTCDDAHRLLLAGAEKVVLANAAVTRPEFVREASDAFGSSSIVVCLDVKRDWLGRYRLQCRHGASALPATPAEAAAVIEQMGAGELIIQSVDRDGAMDGYDLELVNQVADAVTIPVVALGGAGEFADIAAAAGASHASAFASGSAFCFQDRGRGVLISYPADAELATLFSDQ